MPNFKFLRLTVGNGIATVTIDNPKVNAVTQPMYVEMQEFFSQAASYLPDARAIILTGAGKHFCVRQ